MNINVTLFGEMLTFAVLVWVTMKYVWPPIISAMQERQQKISAGLEAAERGQRNLELAQKSITEQLRGAKRQAEEILEQASRQSIIIIEDARIKAQKENQRIIELAKNDIEQEVNKVKCEIKQQMGMLVVTALEKFLVKETDAGMQKKLIDQFIEELQ